jgi:hypothetical protein
MIARVTLATAILLGVLAGQNKATEKTPQFSDYPVNSILHGVPVAPKLLTSGQRRFRSMIRQGAKKGANFAGHYAIAEWGCGTSCVQIALVDVESGDVYEGPFGPIPKVSIYLGPNAEADKTGVFYRRDSGLFVARGCPNFRRCGTQYYRWTGSEFTLFRRIPMKALPGSDNSGQSRKPVLH